MPKVRWNSSASFFILGRQLPKNWSLSGTRHSSRSFIHTGIHTADCCSQDRVQLPIFLWQFYTHIPNSNVLSCRLSFGAGKMQPTSQISGLWSWGGWLLLLLLLLGQEASSTFQHLVPAEGAPEQRWVCLYGPWKMQQCVTHNLGATHQKGWNLTEELTSPNVDKRCTAGIPRDCWYKNILSWSLCKIDTGH